MATQAGGNACACQDGTPDAALVERYKRGDKSAYDTLATRHLSAVNAVICCAMYRQRGRIDLETRDRLVQEALIKACGSIDQCRQPDKFARWLGRIALRVVADDGRALRRKKEIHASQINGRDEGNFDDLWRDPRYGRGGVLEIVADAEEAARLAPVVRRALRGLSQRQRQIVTLWYRHGMHNKEIARKLGLNEHTVSSHLCEGRKKLRQLLDRAESNGLQGRKNSTAAGGSGQYRSGTGVPSPRMSRLPKVPGEHSGA